MGLPQLFKSTGLILKTLISFPENGTTGSSTTRLARSRIPSSCVATLQLKPSSRNVLRLLKLGLHGLLQLDCAVMLRYFNRNFSIEVASRDCFTLVTKVCQIKNKFLLLWKFSQIIWHSLHRSLKCQWLHRCLKLKQLSRTAQSSWSCLCKLYFKWHISILLLQSVAN